MRIEGFDKQQADEQERRDFICNTDDGACRFRADLAELQRYREREHLVQAVIKAAGYEPDGPPGYADRLIQAAVMLCYYEP